MRPWYLVLLLLGGTAVGATLPRVDHTRAARAVDDALVFLPRADTTRIAASGFDEMVADFLWIRAVLLFGDRFDRDRSGAWRAWLAGMLDTTSTLDPAWPSVYHYGGAMLRVVGDVDGSSALFERCTQNIPTDGWCAFSLGMNHYLYRKDVAEAQRWIDRAAQQPGAPGWWSSAAAKMASGAGAIQAAIDYVDSEMEGARSDAERGFLLLQKRRLQHDQLVESWTAACLAYREQHGAPLPGVSTLESLGFAVPENPRGNAWVVGRDGVVRGEDAEWERRRRARSEERRLVVVH